jgi:hypothetical protein
MPTVCRPLARLMGLTRILLSLCIRVTYWLLLLLLGAIGGAAVAAKAAERRSRARWRSDAVRRLTDASSADLRRLIGELPPWVSDGAFHKARHVCVSPTMA